jgi:alcohol dehydrogenase (cytochrome c)
VAYSAGNLFAGSAKGDSVWLFGLDGTIEPAVPGDAIPAVSSNVSGPANLDNGRAVYDAACLFCHGEQGEGGHGGGPTLAAATGAGVVAQLVAEGRNDMPAFEGALSAEQIRDVSAYVVERLAP